MMSWDALCRQFHRIRTPHFSENHSRRRRISSINEIHNWKALNEKGSYCHISIRRYVRDQVLRKKQWYEERFVTSDLTIYIYSADPKPTREPYASYMAKVYVWLSSIVIPALLHRSTIVTPQSLIVTLWITPFRKMFSTFMTPKNINSGEQSGNEISIWRHEEWSKTYIHECLHALGWERYFFGSGDGKRNSYESWVEFWASFFHVLTQYPHNKWRAAWTREVTHFHRLARQLWKLKQEHAWTQRGTSWKGYYLYKYAWTHVPLQDWFHYYFAHRNETDFIYGALKELWARARHQFKTSKKKNTKITSMRMTITPEAVQNSIEMDNDVDM